jgi:hypothetical protein
MTSDESNVGWKLVEVSLSWHPSLLQMLIPNASHRSTRI